MAREGPQRVDLLPPAVNFRSTPLPNRPGVAGGRFYLQGMDALEETVRRFVSKGANVPENRVSMTTRLGTDLGMDSLDLIDLVMALEQHFEIMVDDEEIHAINSVQEIVDLVRLRT